METTTVKRSELYKLVWKTPMTHLAKRFNITVKSLKETCVSRNIPLPPNGYWSKLKFKKHVQITPLPKDFTGEEEIDFNEVRLIGSSPDSILSLEDRIIQEIESNPELPIKVPDRIPKPDQLIIDYKKHFEAVRKYRHDKSGDYPFRDNILNINVSDDQIVRALRFIDTFIKLLKARKHGIINRNNKSYVVIEGEEIEFKLKEKNKVSETKDRWGSKQYISTGELVFIIGDYHTKTISDGKQLLENKLVKISAIIEAKGKQEHIERLDREIRWAEQREKDLIEKERKERKEKELQKTTALLDDANRWHQVKILRGYLREVEEKVNSSGDLTPYKMEWIEWANEKANWLDPLIIKDDSLLNDLDKKIVFK